MKLSAGIILAGLTFILGTIIFAMYFFSGDSSYAIIGYFYFIAAFFINLLAIPILFLTRDKSRNVRIVWKQVGLMLLNLPVGILYFLFGMYLLDIMRVEFVNRTEWDLKNIKIEGCEIEIIPSLNKRESTTVWIDINSDCQINIEYKDPYGEIHSEIVMGYVTNTMGQIVSYDIGSEQEVLF